MHIQYITDYEHQSLEFMAVRKKVSLHLTQTNMENQRSVVE